MGSLLSLPAKTASKCILMAEFAEEDKFVGLHLNRGSPSEFIGGISRVGVHFSANCKCSINFNEETAEKRGLWVNSG